MTTGLTEGTRTVDTRLGVLNVEIRGSGAPALLWHSMFVDSRTWERVVPALADRRTLVLVDGPSSGRSDPLRRRSTIAECADVALEILDALGLDAVDWLGNAWGGHVGIALAARTPGRVRSLIAIGSPTHHLTGAVRAKVLALKPVYRLLGPIPPVTGALLESLLSDSTRAGDPAAVETVASAFRAADRAGLAHAIRSFVLDRPDLHDEARSITAPTLFIATDDRGEWTPDEAADEVGHMRNATLVTLHGGRALPALEAPDAVVGAVTSFWDRPV